MAEWVVIGVGFIQFVFFIGVFYEKMKSKGNTVENKVENHDGLLKELSNQVSKVATKVNLIESESNSNKESLHKMRNDMNNFMASTNLRFERSEKNQSVQLMLMSQICEKLGVNTEMAKFLMVE
jgi:uncharacterized FlaG/YvyC family protein